MQNIFSALYRVRSYETDFRGRVRTVTLLNYLQDAASSHAALLGFSVADLREKNVTWMLTRYHVRLMRYPGEGDDVRVRTWRSALEGVHALRDFEMLDAADNRIGVATSCWVALNLETRRPVRIGTLFGEFPVLGYRALQDDFRPLPKSDAYPMEMACLARMGDIDSNRHVNHTVYAEWALETVPREVLAERLPVEIEVAYRAEAKYGERVVSRSAPACQDDSSSYLHQLVREGDGKELTRLRTVWRNAGALCG